MPARPESPRPPAYVQVFGLTIALQDDLDVAGLQRLCDRPDGEAATIVRHDRRGLREAWSGALPDRTREVCEDGRLLLSVDHDRVRGYLLGAPGIGLALISPDGLDVRCAPELGARDWEALLIGQVLPLVATLREREVFHAAGVVHRGRAQLLCAAQGVGKTSLATRLVMSGAALLGDDVVAVDNRLVAHPGCTVLNVRDPELQRMQPSSLNGLSRLGVQGGRTRFACERPSRARPLGAIYLLERSADGPEIESIPRPAPSSLLGATFNLSVRTPERLYRHLELCARLAEQIPVFRVRILPGRGAADLASTLASHLESHEAAAA